MKAAHSSVSQRILTSGLLLASVGFVPRAHAQAPTAGMQAAQSVTVTVKEGDAERKAEIKFLLFLPTAYGTPEKKDVKWPLLLFLHGGGERGDNLELVKRHGPPKIVEQKKDFPFVTVSPQCPAEKQWNADELAKLVEHVANTYQVDPKRMYVTGLALGGTGTWDMLAKHPGKFAAAVPICGPGDPAAAEKMKGTPIWVFHGAKDQSVPIAKSEEMVEAIKKAGGNVKFTVYPEATHDSWTETYNNDEVYKWLLEQKLP
ncbi:MAG TPA: prolyl oligopeptidase family serine peptidase [Pirellulaceae bacterium]|nr:prolyl oligopeptidase family serine peptidase [Pirellulaceae bacterium]